jgi:protein tyrosine phosphatase type 4A
MYHRAPVLVAIALMEQGLEAEDAVQMIRRNRKGAINSKQLRFLQKYKPRSQQACCVIS